MSTPTDPAAPSAPAAPLRVLFAGTPETAVPVLEALLDSTHDVVAVLTRPDAPIGRKRVLTPSPVAAAAEAAGIRVLKADRLRGDAGADTRAVLAELALDVAVVVAYGALVPREALDTPRHGWLNLHFSHLPAYRGAAPVQRAVLDGVAQTGADVFRIEEGLDTGPVFARLTRGVAAHETSGELLADLAQRGGPLVIEVLDALAAGAAVARPQEGEPTHAPKLTAADGLVDPAQGARAVAARINGVTPEPGAWGWLVPAGPDDVGEDASAEDSTEVAATPVRLKLAGVAPVSPAEPDWPVALDDAAPGAFVTAAGSAWLRTADGAVRLTQVQPAGKKLMAAADWARGVPAPVTLLAGNRLAAHEGTLAEQAVRRQAEQVAAATHRGTEQGTTREQTA